MPNADYPAVYLGRSLAPIYVQLSTIFRRLIENGEWPVARQMPTHERLAAQFGVNATTVRKAVAMLARDGLLKTYRRRGTFVVAKPARREWYDVPTSWAAALAAHKDLTVEPLDSARAGSRHVIRRLYWRGEEPLCLEIAHLDLKLKARLGARKLRLTPFPVLLDEKTVARADETVTFGIADRDTAAQLRIPLNAPIAIVHLTTLDRAGAVIFDSKSYFRGDCIRILERIKP
ncbi:MAG TPA: GntR family transcriptional regulator [Stellaceae bacterium]|nr:GntR family transcriptional regulator [Stellaceae bacterium]